MTNIIIQFHIKMYSVHVTNKVGVLRYTFKKFHFLGKPTIMKDTKRIKKKFIKRMLCSFLRTDRNFFGRKKKCKRKINKA